MTYPVRVALVHDWLTGMRGGEYVLEAIAELFPRSDLFTLLYIPGSISPVLTTLNRHVSWLQKVPKIEKRYRNFLPLMPWTIGKFDLSGFDLVISSSHCVAKGISKPKGSVHVSYIHAPMRYMWDRYDDYFGPGRASSLVRLAAKSVRKYLQKWDRGTSTEERIDALVANSSFISGQIKRIYNRESSIIHPFADTSRFTAPRKPSKTYLIVSAFAPYKRLDIAIDAFNKLKLPLMVVGSGQDLSRLKKKAGPTVDLLGSLSNSAIADLYAKCKALVFPGLEDFGITPVEAMAAGLPVIAYGEGGVLDTVTDRTGVLFKPQTTEALIEAVLKFEKGEVSVSEEDCRARAAEFNKAKFQREFVAVLKTAWSKAGKESALLDETLSKSWASY
ncbi:MAG: hypothetical protein A3K03_05220 [Bdellovibrionales bacterium RIFOXYD1_FULL_44_7]|nr:MAG: hypothetical protein A3K03_05220 [Bdellovibrionales bacterium RIFOXYD1_FULL_44_7]